MSNEYIPINHLNGAKSMENALSRNKTCKGRCDKLVTIVLSITE